MSTPKNKQMLLKPRTLIAPKFLKFCYILLAFLALSCKNETTNTSKEDVQNKNQTDIAKIETTTNTILCFGDSITAGYGLDDSADAFPAVLQQKIDSLNLNYTVVNSGLSGETSAGGKSRIGWVSNQNIAVFILELGANDGLRGVPLSETRLNLQAIIDAVKEKQPKATIILAGMELPPNMGQDYTNEFRAVYADLAATNNLEFIPFILKDVGGIAELNQSDGNHPTIKGHKIVANTVWKTLKPLLKK